MTGLQGRDPLVVAGIDPGTACMGYGIVARAGQDLHAIDHGVFRTRPSMSHTERLCHLHGRVQSLLGHHAPDVVSLEQAFHHKNVQSAFRLGEVRATVHVAAGVLGIPVMEYPSAVVKKSVASHGGASKELVTAFVRERLGIDEELASHDAADALALALCLLCDPALDPRFEDMT